MSKFIFAALLAVSLSAADTGPKTESPAEKPEPAAKAAAKQSDRGAREVKQTPFGPVEAKPTEAPPRQDLTMDSMVSAREEGDVVIFRRKTPFGNQVWKKKKSELTAEERKLLARERPEPPNSSRVEPGNPAKDAEETTKSEAGGKP